jgi:hypothetical protein
MSNLTSRAIELKSAGTAVPQRSPAVETTLATRMVSPGTADTQRRAELHLELVQQFAPVGAIEQLLVVELARRATELEQRSTTACSLREVATALGQAVLRQDGFGLTGNALLAAAVSSDAVEKADRASASHSRAFFRALRALLELQDRRATAALPAAPDLNHDFDTEAKCVEYLAGWQCRQFRCRHCGGREAGFLRAKRCLQCAACGRQTGLRAATAMADSALPLKIWFDAIQLLFVDPNLSAAELQRRLSIRRIATVRALARRVRAALTADDCTMLLAGLDQKLTEAASSAPHPEKNR